MKKIILVLMLVLSTTLMGCGKEKINLTDPVIQAASQLAIARYIEKNSNAAKYIIEANSVIEGMEDGSDINTYSIIYFKNEILKNVLNDEMTEPEKREIILLTDFIFALINQQLEVDWFQSVDPEYLEQIKLFFAYAAETAKLYEVKKELEDDKEKPIIEK